MQEVLDEADFDLFSNGIPNHDFVFLELQHRHVLLHLHFGWTSMSGVGNVSLENFLNLQSTKMLTEAMCMKRGCHDWANPCHGIVGRILLDLANSWRPAILYPGVSLHHSI